MKLFRNYVVLAAALLITVIGSSAMAKSMWQIIEFDNPIEPGYVSCLGEEVGGYIWVTIRSREFETPSGNFHYIEYWTWEAEWLGETTGRVWLGDGKSPGAFNAAKGEVGQWTSRELARPIAGDGPRFRYNVRFKYAVNANGDLRVFYEPPEALNDWIRCLGPKD
jgi:hypothetical protein